MNRTMAQATALNNETERITMGRTAGVVLCLLLVAAPSLTAQSDADRNPRTSPVERLGRAVGAALVGGWLGFVGAQVVQSDWDKDRNGDFSQQRATWMAAGMVAGVVGLRLLDRDRPARPWIDPPAGSDRQLILAPEIRETRARTALEVVRVLRPEWLVIRGVNSWRESARGQANEEGVSVTPGDATLVVYLDGLRLGGVEAMNDVAATTLMALEYYEPHRAAVRFGAGTAHGAILLSTATGTP